MALKLDNDLLVELGLGALPDAEKQLLLRQIYEKLEMNVGMRLADQMSNEQLDAFEKFVDANDDKGAFQWLETNFPNYKDVVNQEFEKLKAEIRTVAPQILANAQANPMPPAQPGQPGIPGAPAGPAPGQPYPGQPGQPVPPNGQYPPQPAPGQYAQPQYPPQGPPAGQYGGYQPQPGAQPGYGPQPGYAPNPGAPGGAGSQLGHLQPQYGAPGAPQAGQPGQQPPAGPPPASPPAQ